MMSHSNLPKKRLEAESIKKSDSPSKNKTFSSRQRNMLMYSSAGRSKDVSKQLGDEVKDDILEDEFFTFI